MTDITFEDRTLNIVTKACSKCGITKPKDRFAMQTRKNKKKGTSYRTLASWCKSCRSKHYSKYYRANFDRLNEKHKKYYHDNREERLKVMKAYNDRNRAYVTYRLDFENGTYWIGSTVNLKKRLVLHNHRLAHGTHTKRMLALCGGDKYEVTTLEVFQDEPAARAAELALLHEHVGNEKCLNTLKRSQIHCWE